MARRWPSSWPNRRSGRSPPWTDAATRRSPYHFACDGLVAYIHTFTQFRKYQDMLRDGRVSYTVWHEPTNHEPRTTNHGPGTPVDERCVEPKSPATPPWWA